MLSTYINHNRFKVSIEEFAQLDPHLYALSQLPYQHSSDWWKKISLENPGIYILTGGRQIGKSTSCKLFIKYCLMNNIFQPDTIFYLPCDEIYDSKELSKTCRFFINNCSQGKFLLIIDEITFVDQWERVIKALADEGLFNHGHCLITGSDTLILKEASMSFPGRRGTSDHVDFHLYPLSFYEYVKLIKNNESVDDTTLQNCFNQYLSCGGYLRAINDLAQHGTVTTATYLTYEQWIRGDMLKRGKNEETLLALLQALLTVGVSQISYSTLTQKIGIISKETCIDYCNLLERMDVLMHLKAFDLNKKQGFPRKDRKFHFTDPFIQHTIVHWLNREGVTVPKEDTSIFVESCVASHCKRHYKTFYFKAEGEIDVIALMERHIQALEVKWSEQIRANDLTMLKHFHHSKILSKHASEGTINGISSQSVYHFLYELR